MIVSPDPVGKIDALQKRITELEAKLAQAEAAGAEMRGVLQAPGCIAPNCGGKGWYEVIRPNRYGEPEQQQEQCQWCDEKAHALSSDCGKPFLEERERMKAALYAAKDRLAKILEGCEHVGNEQGYQTKATQKALDTVNEALNPAET